MTTRTFQFYGQGWGPETAQITATLNGQTVYSGPIPTDPYQPPWSNGNMETAPVLLFTFSALDVTDQGAFPMTVTADVGNVMLTSILSNYVGIQNPIYTAEQWAIITDPSKEQEGFAIISNLANPPFSLLDLEVLENPATTELEKNAILTAHGMQYMTTTGPDGFSDVYWQGDCRTNVAIDDVPVSTPVPRPESLTGDWTWILYTSDILSYDFNLNAGVE